MGTAFVLIVFAAVLALIGMFLYKVFSTANKVHTKFSLWLNK